MNSDTSSWCCTWTTGPDAGAEWLLGPGRYVVGRAATAELRCDDPQLEAHHALLELGSDGAQVTQLTGRIGLHVDGSSPAGSACSEHGLSIDVGGSTLVVQRVTQPEAIESSAAHIRNQTLIRGPRTVPEWTPRRLTTPGQAPHKPDRPSGLLASMLGLAGSVVIAVVLRNPMFLVFGALSGVVAIITWMVQRGGALRAHRRARSAHRREVAEWVAGRDQLRDEFIAYHRRTTTTVVTARRLAAARTAELWERRTTHADAFVVSLGVGDVLWQPPGAETAVSGDMSDRCELAEWAVLDDLPTPVNLGSAERIAVRGPLASGRAVARALVAQLATNCGPADVRFIVVTHEPAAWRCLGGLPHATLADGSLAVCNEAELGDVLTQCETPGDQDATHLVVITDAPELLATRTGPLRRFLTSERAPALVALVAPDSGVPHLCTAQLHLTDQRGRASRWMPDIGASALPQHVRIAGLGSAATSAICRSLEALRDPEDPLGSAAAMPREVRLRDLLSTASGAELTAPAIAASWLAAGPNPKPCAPIGLADDGVVDIDLVRDGPHGLLAGTTGAGKSELLRSLVLGMAVTQSPDHLTFVLVDYKGGATFDGFLELPHVVGMVTDLDDHLADRALRSLHAELRHRERTLREHGASDLDSLRMTAPGVVMPRLVVVIDEFAALVSEQSDFLEALVGIAQRGRSLGVHLLLATQRPSGVISDDIRANTNLRMALRLHDVSDAHDVVGDPAPALLPRGLPGRAVMRLGPDEYLTFQTARCTVDDDLSALVCAVRDASRMVGLQPARRPWLPPLPTEHHCDRRNVALVDDPDRQTQFEMEWVPGGGHLLLAGSVGSGLTTALLTLGAAALNASDSAGQAPGVHLYVIDGIGDERLQVFEREPRCAGVVRLHERERLMRLLHRLVDEVRVRAAGHNSPDAPAVLLFVDGIDAVRRHLDDVDTMTEFEALTEVIAAGAAVGVHVVMTTTLPGSLPLTMLAACGERWVFSLTDAHDALSLGVRPADVPAAVPGRFVTASTGLEGQLGLRALSFAPCVAAATPTPLRVLPAILPVDHLDAPTVDEDEVRLPLGAAFQNGRTAFVEIPDGEHLLVVGPSRSGRSAVLCRLAAAWARANHVDRGDRAVVVLAPRRSPVRDLDGACVVGSMAELLAMCNATGPQLLVIDDAELVDDVNGAFAAIIASHRPGLLVIAAGRPDALRQSYGHWTSVVRRSRLGIVAAGSSDLDGDLVGALLPRRLPVSPRPGLMYIVDNGSLTLVQTALDSVPVDA